MNLEVEIGRIHLARSFLQKHGVEFEIGLSEVEISDLENRYTIVFPPDLKCFLQIAMPVSQCFPNWRGPEAPLLERFGWPAEGICFDISNKAFWWPEWGERPISDADAIAVALRHLNSMPKLIPIYGHSFLPSQPNEAGNPVFSVYQADVIHRGANFVDFLLWAFRDNEEFDEDQYPVFSENYKEIPFWSLLAKRNVF